MGIFWKKGKGFKKDKDNPDQKGEKNPEPDQGISGQGRIPAEASKTLENWRLDAHPQPRTPSWPLSLQTYFPERGLA